MKGMLGWPTRSAKRDSCGYGCCLRWEQDAVTPTKIYRKREKRAWRKELW